MSTIHPTGTQPQKVGTKSDPTSTDAPSFRVRMRRIAVERDSIRIRMLESTFNGAPFFGGLIAFAHATPSLLHSLDVQPPKWTSTVAYWTCILLTWVIGWVINVISEERHGADAAGRRTPGSRRHRVQRIARVFSTSTMLGGLLVSAHNPSVEALATWPITVMTGSYALYEVLHQLARRRRKNNTAQPVNDLAQRASNTHDAGAHVRIAVTAGHHHICAECQTSQTTDPCPSALAPVA